MPIPFTDKQQQDIKEELFRTGIYLSKTLGVKRMTVAKLTSACNIAKGSFYIFFASKEDFIIALTEYASQKMREMVFKILNGRSQMPAHDFFAFLRDYLNSDYDLMNKLTIEDFMWLKTHMSDAELFNPDNQIETIKTYLSLISDLRTDIDLGIVVNLIKSIYAMREHKDTLVETSLDNSIELILRMLEIYITGRGELL